MKHKLSGGLVHELPADLVNALTNTKKISSLWEALTPIGRNEFICWVENATQEKTRVRRIGRTVEELLEWVNELTDRVWGYSVMSNQSMTVYTNCKLT